MKSFALRSVTNKKEPGLRKNLQNFRNCLNREFVSLLKAESSDRSYHELILREPEFMPHPGSAPLRKRVLFDINAVTNELYSKWIYFVVFYQKPLVGL